ncbi:MAG: CHAT domain-containing protein [Symploca sp. SIO2D2]|nr:CHAT domain-containing protein [Symploca sp. SIO2D2]
MKFFQKATNFLRDIFVEAAHKDLVAAIGTPETTTTPEEAFLVEALQVCMRSFGNPQVVYPFLQENLELLNENFASWLRTWTNTIFSRATFSQAARISAAVSTFSTVLQEFPFGSKASNLEIAIAGYEATAQMMSHELFIGPWGESQHNLAAAYCNRVRGDKAENIETAITCCENALQVRTRSSRPHQWARTQIHLAIAYRLRLKGDTAENIEAAITCCKNALQILTYDTFPQEWAKAQHNLMNNYYYRISGNRAENLEQAIDYGQQALKVRTRETFPLQWAKTLLSLGSIYTERLVEDPINNRELGISCYEQALRVCTPETAPELWAMIQSNLGAAYRNRPWVKQYENRDGLVRAIFCFEQVLQVLQREDSPILWATTQLNLANAYSDPVWGNLELAIEHYEEAKQVYTRQDFLTEWALIQNELCCTYFDACVYRFELNERIEGLKQGIACGEEALIILTREKSSQNWAMINNNLAGAYANLVSHDPQQYFPAAVQHGQQALQIYSREVNPYGYINTQFSLGLAYQAVNQFQSAYNAFAEAISTVELLRVVITSGDRAKQKWGTKWNDLYQKIIEVCLALADSKPQYAALALEYVERNKVRVLFELLAKRDQLPPELPNNIRQQWQELQRDISAEQRRLDLAQRTSSSIKIFFTEDEPDLKKLLSSPTLDYSRLNQLRRQLDDLIANHIQPSVSTFNPSQAVDFITFNQIRSLIDENTAIMEWYLTPEQVRVFIITHATIYPTVREYPINWYYPLTEMAEGLPPRMAEYLQQLGEQECTNIDTKNPSLVETYFHYLTTYAQDTEQWQKQLPSALQQFAQLLHLDEIFQSIPKTCNQLILVPHRVIHLLPLHALPLADGSCLLDHFSQGVRYAPSCQLLQLTQQQQRPNFSDLLGIQNPTHDLSYSDIEVSAIQKYFTRNDILEKEQAKKSNLPLQRFKSAHCLHFSCHSSFNFTEPLKSVLVLAGGFLESKPATIETTVQTPEEKKLDLANCLTLEDIFKLDLQRCRLVTLSACETGITDIANVSDEYIGFPSGFLYAGASNVVSSLWNVNDLSTAFLMIKFYHNLQTFHSATVALNQAQLWLRSLTKKELATWMTQSQLDLAPAVKMSLNRRLKKMPDNAQPFKYPFYWAAFCAIGQ